MRCSVLTSMLAVLVTASSVAPRAAQGYPSFQYSWSFPDPAHVEITWTMQEDPSYPIENPAWVGWDIRRQSLSDCDEFVTVSPSTFPRDSGQTHTYSFTDQPPEGAYEYQIVPVDADHNLSGPSYLICDVCWQGKFWVSLPDLGSPVTVGTLDDWKWALHVSPCPGSCYSQAIFEGAMADELRPYADGQTEVRLYGSFGCCSTEGPEIRVDHYVIGTCLGPTPVKPATWGELKVIYR